MSIRLGHLWLCLSLLPKLLWSRPQRLLLGEMRAFCRRLPALLKNPLPQTMRAISPEPGQTDLDLPEAEVRRLADLAALLDRRSPLGLCLRRSLVRYHYLRQVDVPVVVQFGARLLGSSDQRDLTGHAWLTLHGQPYFEADENWQGFQVMIQWPS